MIQYQQSKITKEDTIMCISKKLLSAALALVLTFAFLPTMAFANDDVTVTINGQPVIFDGQGPTVVGGRTLVPVAGVFQALGFDPQWNPETRQVTVTRGDDVIVITVDSNTFITNDVSHTLDVPAQIIGGRTMLPIAAVLRTVGYEVDWDSKTRTVVITFATPESDPTSDPTSDLDAETLEDYDYYESEIEDTQGYELDEDLDETATEPAEEVDSLSFLSSLSEYDLEYDYNEYDEYEMDDVEELEAELEDYPEEEEEATPEASARQRIRPTQEETQQTLAGTWIVGGRHQLMLLLDDGTGHMFGETIGWFTNDGVLSICTTPDICQRIGFCVAPAMQWYYTLDRNSLTLVSLDNSPELNFNASRRR